ncbi:MAG: substrate-binding domain-containing protein, partial [Arachnia sp.]
QVYPPLTTVRQSFDELGARCMEILLAKISHEEPDNTPLTPRLVVRQSAGAPRRAEPRILGGVAARVG